MKFGWLPSDFGSNVMA